MNSGRWIVFICFVFFSLIYFGFDTKPNSLKQIERSRASQFTNTGIENLLRDARARLSADTLVYLDNLIRGVNSEEPEDYVENLKSLSAFWYSMKNYAIAGYYAKEIAELVNSEESWSISGTTFAQGLTGSATERETMFCFQNAVSSFENAVSLAPESVAHQLNLALCYVKMPLKENPMKGIQMLLDLNDRFPDYLPVKMNLAKLAMETGQYDRAISRLLEVLDMAPDDLAAICSLAEAYRASGQETKASQYSRLCVEQN